MAKEIGHTDNNLLKALEHAVVHDNQVDQATTSKLGHAKQNLLRSAELLKKNELAKAEIEDRATLESLKQYPELHLNLATVLARQNKFDDAIAELREAIRLEPTFAEAHSLLGHVFEAQSDSAAALVIGVNYIDGQVCGASFTIGEQHSRIGH